MSLEAQYYQDGDFIDWTPTAAVAAGEVLRLKDGRAAVAENAIAAGVKGAARVKGIVKVAKTTSMLMLVGSRLYWDHSASKATLVPGLNTFDSYLGCAQEDGTAAATTILVDLNAEPKYTLALRDGFQCIPVQTAGFPQMYGGGNGVGMFFGVTAEAMKLDALGIRNVPTATPGILSVLLSVNVNMDNSAGDFNVGLADGTHASDADSIVSSLFMHMDGANLSMNFESDNAAAEVASTDSTLDAVLLTPVCIQWDLRDWADIKAYVNGLRVCDGTTGTARTFTLAGVTGPLALLVHMEKSADDSPGNFFVMDMGFTAFDV